MRPAHPGIGERPAGPPKQAEAGGRTLSPSAKRRHRREQQRQYVAHLVADGAGQERRETIAAQKTQIVEHRRSVTSYANGGKDSR